MRKIFVFDKPPEDEFTEFGSGSSRPSFGEEEDSIQSSFDYMSEAISSLWHPTVGQDEDEDIVPGYWS